jgi:hypothetical protein
VSAENCVIGWDLLLFEREVANASHGSTPTPVASCRLPPPRSRLRACISWTRGRQRVHTRYTAVARHAGYTPRVPCRRHVKGMHQAGSTSPMESLPGSAALYTWSGRQPGTTVSRPPPQPDWSRPIRVGAPSVLARKRRYAPVASGTRSPADSRPSAQHGTSRHSLINSLNLRVRGSSPWRRTRSDLAV